MLRGTPDQYQPVEGKPNTWRRIDANDGLPMDADGNELAIFNGMSVAQYFVKVANDAAEEANEAAWETAFKAEPDRIDLINRLRTATPAQINSWIDANVTSLAAARAVFKALIKVLAVHIKS